MFVGGALSAVLGAVIGYLGFRFGLRGFYFVLLTVAFAEICRIVALNTDAIGGALGLYITFTGNPRQFQFQDNRVYYYVALGLMLGGDRRSWRGSSATASAPTSPRSARTRRRARRSASTPSATRCSRWSISSFLTGVGGTFYAFYLFSLQPNAVFGIPLSVEIIIRPIVGGAGTVLGPDPRLVHPRARSPRSRAPTSRQGGWSGAHLIVYGVLLIAVVLFLPQGAYPFLARRLGAARRGERPRAPRGPGLSQALRRPPGRRATSSFDVAPRRDARAHRPQRGGQDHRLQPALGLPRPRRGRRCASTAAALVGLKPHAICRLGLARTFQIVRPFPRLSVLDNVRVGALGRHPAMAARPRAGAGGDRARRARGQDARGGGRPDPAPSASGSSWRARSPPSRACSCSTR